MDLVEVAPNSKPPVCKILDFGKMKYEEKKKEQYFEENQEVNDYFVYKHAMIIIGIEEDVNDFRKVKLNTYIKEIEKFVGH